MRPEIVLALWLLQPAKGAPQETVVPFRTQSAPRVDPVFGDATSFRAGIDRFLALSVEMARTRDEFSDAVHATLADLAGPRPATGARCPEAARAHYALALSAGAGFLKLGRQLEARFREVRRQDDLGDTVGLTPDYRAKVRKVREQYRDLLRDLREMKIAFYDQLGGEMQHAGCALPDRAAGAKADPSADPSNPAAWDLDPEIAEARSPAEAPSREAPPGRTLPPPLPPPSAKDTKAGAAADARSPAGPAAPPIWIEIDNTGCGEPSRLTVDGVTFGEIAGKKKTSVRTHAGPHEVCVLPVSDARTCGAPGTLRKAYLHEGWSVTVRCSGARGPAKKE